MSAQAQAPDTIAREKAAKDSNQASKDITQLRAEIKSIELHCNFIHFNFIVFVFI